MSYTNSKVLFVAEVSANHNQSLERAIEIVEKAAQAGATAVKLQTYTPDSMTLNISSGDFVVPAENRLWGGRSFYDLYQDAMTPWEWHKALFDRTIELGMVPFSSPFDESAVDFLESLDCPIYKIAAFELVDLELIKYAASTKKPMIISTGMGTLQEIADAVDTARLYGCTDLTLLKTTSSYPATPENSNLKTMVELQRIFEVKVGISDHTLGIGASVAAVALGATVVEKHLTLRRLDGGVDSGFSMEPLEFEALVRESEVARQAVGKIVFGPSSEDLPSLGFRRSLYVSKDVSAGDLLTRENVRAVRPGFGMPVKLLNEVIGLSFTHDTLAGTPLSFDLFT